MGPPRAHRQFPTVLLFATVLAVPWAAWSQVKEVKKFDREMEIRGRDGSLEFSVDFPEVFTKRLRHRLSSGFTSLILVDLMLTAENPSVPVAQDVLQYTILYDIWEEQFNVRKEGPRGRRDLQLRTMNDLVGQCGKIDNLPLALLRNLPAGRRYRLQVRITVNPASPELRRKVKEYLANPDGTGRIGGPRSFFGSFSRIFVSEKDFQADAVYTYRSQTFDLPSGQ